MHQIVILFIIIYSQAHKNGAKNIIMCVSIINTYSHNYFEFIHPDHVIFNNIKTNKLSPCESTIVDNTSLACFRTICCEWFTNKAMLWTANILLIWLMKMLIFCHATNAHWNVRIVSMFGNKLFVSIVNPTRKKFPPKSGNMKWVRYSINFNGKKL